MSIINTSRNSPNTGTTEFEADVAGFSMTSCGTRSNKGLPTILLRSVLAHPLSRASPYQGWSRSPWTAHRDFSLTASCRETIAGSLGRYLGNVCSAQQLGSIAIGQLVVVRRLKAADDAPQLAAGNRTTLFIQSAPGRFSNEYSFDVERKVLESNLKGCMSWQSLPNPSLQEITEAIHVAAGPSIIHVSGLDSFQGMSTIDPKIDVNRLRMACFSATTSGKKNWSTLFVSRKA
jgi:hypothetical protein